MRRVVFALLIAASANGSAPALLAQDPETPVFRTGTTLIEFTIVARDSKGNPVTDLTKDDLIVTEQGQRRAIEFFRFDGEPSPASIALPQGRYTNRFDTRPNPARHITAVLVDGGNTMPVSDTLELTQAGIRNQILTYLNALPPQTYVGLFRHGIGAIKILHEFTDDLEALKASLASMDLVLPAMFDSPGHRPRNFSSSGNSQGGSPEAAEARAVAFAAFAKATGGINEIVQASRVDSTLPGLEALGDHLARFPGRKSIVWVGNGMPIRMGARGASRDFETQMRAAAERLATQNVAIYPVASQLSEPSVRESLHLFADVTGGRVTLTLNDPTEGLSTTAVDQRAIYSIGFYAVAPPDNKWHPISVQVRRPGVTVTHRRGYLAETPAAQPLEWNETQWRTAFGNPLLSSVVRLDAQFAPVLGVAAGTVDLRMQMATDDLHFRETGGKRVAEVDIAVAEKVASGELAFRVERATLSLPINARPGATAPYARQWALRPNTTHVRVIVRDRFTARYGTLDIPISLP